MSKRGTRNHNTRKVAINQHQSETKTSHAHPALADDLRHLIARRQTLKLLTAGAAACLVGACDNGGAFSGPEAERTAKGPDGTMCTALPGETAGPFPADGSNNAHGTLANVLDDTGIVRRDMRPDIGGGPETAAPGTPLELTIKLEDVNRACAPLAGYALYLWHCDAVGNYSIYNTKQHNHLRGVAVSDENGEMQFTTIIPGCYPGRFPHMHFEVYRNLAATTDYRNRLLTSQLALPPAVCKAVYEGDESYSASRAAFARTSLAGDMIFADNTENQRNAQLISIKSADIARLEGVVNIALSA